MTITPTGMSCTSPKWNTSDRASIVAPLSTIAHALVIWCGLALLIGGSWALLVAGLPRRDRVVVFVALAVMVLGGALLVRALASD